MARLRLIACEVFFREFCAVLVRSRQIVDVEFVEQGLHDCPGAAMAARLQERVDAADGQGYDALLLGYGLCNGLSGVRARSVPLVITRAHDCITLFLGSKERYSETFNQHPGSYYLTSGWIERARRSLETLPSRREGAKTDADIHAGFVAKYGEDNAQFLLDALKGWRVNYGRMVFIDTGVGNRNRLRAHAKSEASIRKIDFAELEGDLRLFQGLVDGPPWSPEDFLVVPPGHSIHPSYDARVMEARAGVSAHG